MQLPSTINS